MEAEAHKAAGLGILPRVSVICAFLDCERFLVEALDSVLTQTYQNFELLLIDDGSTDSSSAIARSYAQLHPDRVFYRDHPGHANVGVSASRNIGLKMARGEFVTFIDGDDVWVKEKLAEQLEVMERHPELGMVCGAACYWSSWRQGGADDVLCPGHVQNCVVYPPDAALAVYPLGQSVSPCVEMMIRRSIIMELGGCEVQFRRLFSDQDLHAKLYLACPVYFSDRLWLYYRQHDGSMSVRDSDSHMDAYRRFLSWYREYVDQLPQPADPRVVVAIERRRFRFLHPVLFSILQSIRRVRQALASPV